ncbi:sterol desaturase family protein [Flavilitoribacter nigricans]|uniref:Sterol desaturase n=1 Tax=Flavilitoribacter nigricans (strain ATCC 23147 / DSM 23189 / NBRC 102662 / NCIMB 1420 / SS-2) TaxID=1122177 RepID=A0A2D0NHV3_FLAN2|nr:sterol desaturase family protein [Flavilitoribacter nigricans]PHN07998.1 sterol desaturase [Flavilitoribacter nigricans DSM 23189 = NBRC 102662]
METYAQVLNYAIPFFILLMLVEEIAARWMRVEVNRGVDTISSLSSGFTNVIKDVLGLTIVILSYGWLVDKVALTEIKSGWLLYVIAFLAMDLSSYWVHRWSHEINFLWNRHIIHHSSEEFNLACALRQSISNIFSYFNFLLLPAALLGVPTEVIAVVAPIHLFAQFWYHTKLIDKMGWLEHILVTPSHHRVHHAINQQYLDKNYAAIFIFWDKWFGTFQEEREDIPPVYGVKRPVKTWNPFLINFQHLALLARDAWYTRNWWDKIRLWFMPTGWRPADVADRFPITGVEDVYAYQKYDTRLSSQLLVWSWTQLAITFVLMLYLFNRIGDLSFIAILLYGIFLFVSVFSFTTLMDKSPYALATELVRSGLGLALIWWQQDWFGMSSIVPYLNYLIAAYLIFSPLVVYYFVRTECRDTAEAKAPSAPHSQIAS